MNGWSAGHEVLESCPLNWQCLRPVAQLCDTIALMRRIFLDTEFKNLPWSGHSELLWVGLADEEGNSWSAINADVAIDDHASDFTRRVVAARMTPDEPRLPQDKLASAIQEFCGAPDEFWAWCPTVELLADFFGLGDEAPSAFARFWDWDLQLLRRVVTPWPAGWPTALLDLNALARQARVAPPRNDSAHHPRDDALWNREVYRLIEASGASQ